MCGGLRTGWRHAVEGASESRAAERRAERAEHKEKSSKRRGERRAESREPRAERREQRAEQKGNSGEKSSRDKEQRGEHSEKHREGLHVDDEYRLSSNFFGSRCGGHRTAMPWNLIERRRLRGSPRRSPHWLKGCGVWSRAGGLSPGARQARDPSAGMGQQLSCKRFEKVQSFC